MTNIHIATFKDSRVASCADALYQYDYGQILQFAGIELPAAYEVHFSTTLNGTATTVIGNSEGVAIPDSFLQSAGVLYAWVYLHAGDSDGETRYVVTMVIRARAGIDYETPSEEQQSAIDQAISALNHAVEQTTQDVIDANTAQEAAEEAQGKAENAQSKAEQAQGAAEAAQEAAETASVYAGQSAEDAAESARQAAQAALEAEHSAENARGSASAAEQAEEDALEHARNAAESAEAADASEQETLRLSGIVDEKTNLVTEKATAIGEAESRIDAAEERINRKALAVDEGARIATEAKGAAIEAISHHPVTLNGTWWEWDVENETYVDTGVPATGPKGDPGKDYVITEENIQEIADMVAESEGIAGAVTDAKNSEEEAKKWVDGKDLEGHDVPSTAPQFENNAKYYRTLTSQDATRAENAKTAIQNMGVSATTLPAGSSATVTKTVDPQTGAVNLEYGLPKGQDGIGAVDDVQIDGTSILENGIANIPTANASRLGVIKTSIAYGTGYAANGSGILMIQKANDEIVKTGTGSGSANRPIVPANQHMSTFYGLAKAAGDTTQSASSNTVGNYTETAKSKIHDMLDAPVTVSGTTPVITAMPGVRYVCGEVSTLDITLPASGCIDVTFESGSTATVLTITPPSGQTVKWANGFDPTALEANTTYEINICDGLGVAGSWT